MEIFFLDGGKFLCDCFKNTRKAAVLLHGMRKFLSTGLNLLHETKFQRILSGKSVFLKSIFQIRELYMFNGVREVVER